MKSKRYHEHLKLLNNFVKGNVGDNVSKYISKYVKCPYYRRNNDNRICCEGVDETNTLNLVFPSKKKLKYYIRIYCESMNGHRECKIKKMLDDKWNEK